jgi:hypothetical protein
MSLDPLKYPIGKFTKPEVISSENIVHWISAISSFPQRLIHEVSHLNDEQLETQYRPGGWTIRQVIHHCADSHLNSITRFKLALTEEQPTIKPYFEERWAELADCKKMPILPSLKILEGIHERWTVLLKSLKDEDFGRTFIHPEHGTKISIGENIGIYAWHSNHHLAHITMAKRSNKWD